MIADITALYKLYNYSCITLVEILSSDIQMHLELFPFGREKRILKSPPSILKF